MAGRWRWAVLVSVSALVLGACSGGDASTSSSRPPGTTDPRETAAPDENATSVTATSTAPSDGDTGTTAPAATTTTEAPPVVVPLGVRWQNVDTMTEVALQASPRSIGTVGDELWMFAGRGNSSVVVRSNDDGLTWEQVPVVAPPSSGAQTVRSIVAGPDGRLVGSGAIGSICQVNIEIGDGYREVGLCERFRPVLYLSDDAGASWRQIEPPAMSPSGDTTVFIEGLVATPTGYLAAGTVKGQDWHVRLWSSPDGEAWSLDREIRGDGAPISARQLIANDDEIVLLADEHPCARVSYNTPGWYLGPTWVEHLRIYSGTSADDLALLGADDHPFAHDPESVECATAGNDLDRIAELDALYRTASGAVIGGVITMLEEVAKIEEPDDVDVLTSGTRRIAQLIEGDWVSTEIADVQSPNEASGSELIDVDGRPGIMETRRNGQVLIDLVPILPVGDGSWVQQVPEQSAIATRVHAGVWSGGALVVVGSLYDDPYATTITPENRLAVQVWRSVESTGSPAELCQLQSGGSCRFSDLSLVDGYPDFAGIDLSGADLSFTDFGDADFSGADFTGAKLWEITTGEASSVEGTDFTDASLPKAAFGNARGAMFDGAILVRADLVDATGSSFVGTDLESAELSFSSLPNLDGATLNYADLEMMPPAVGEPFEVSLDGLDLTNAEVSATRDGPRLTITSVSGTVLFGTLFKNVDLTALDPTLVDLTDVDVWDDSICPDGLPPDDPPIGTCVRG